MTESELLELCDTQNVIKGKAQWLYWTSEVYGFGVSIRQYGFYPQRLPLAICFEHGLGGNDVPSPLELNSGAPYMIYHSERRVYEWKKISNKPCYSMPSPFVLHRRRYNINKASHSNGTLAFPAHSTPHIDDTSDITIYIRQLKEIPPEFHPISVCLHMNDIHKGRHKIFMDHGIPVYTAGHWHDYRFTERFYNILKNFKYATSNFVGSYLYYAVEMGIPFSIYGNREKFINKSDPNITVGEFDNYSRLPIYRKTYDLFHGLQTSISNEQKNFIEEELGLRGGINRVEAAALLYTALLKYNTRKIVEKYTFRNISRYLKKRCASIIALVK